LSFGKIAAGARWMVGAQWISLAVSFGVLAMLGRILRPDDFGLFALVMVVVAIANAGFTAAFREPLVQRQTVTETDLATVFWTTAVLGLLVAGGMALLAAPIANALEAPPLAPLLRLAALKVLADALGSVPMALVLRRMEFAALGQRTLVVNVSASLLALALAFAGAGVWSLVLQQVYLSVALTALLALKARWLPRGPWSGRAQKSFAAYTGSVAGWQALDFVDSQLDRGLIGTIQGTQALGYYTSGRRLTDLVVETTTSALMQIVLPVFSGLQNDMARIRQEFVRLIGAVAIVVCPASVGLAVVAPVLVPAFLGPQWTSAIPITQIFAAIVLYRAIGAIQSVVLRSVGQSGWIFALRVVQSAAYAGAVILAVPHGIYWTAAAIIAVDYLFLPVMLARMHRIMGIRLAEFGVLLGRPLLAALAMGAALLGVNALLCDAPGRIVSLVIDIALGPPLYLGASLLLNGTATRAAIGDIRRIIRTRAQA
jgi:PST family polysaccharide transporter